MLRVSRPLSLPELQAAAKALGASDLELSANNTRKRLQNLIRARSATINRRGRAARI